MSPPKPHAFHTANAPATTPLQNERQLGNMVTLLNETFGECKDLYNTCQLDLNSSAVLQYLPLEHIIFEKGFKKDAKSQQKEQKN